MCDQPRTINPLSRLCMISSCRPLCAASRQCASVGHWLTLWPHNRRLFFQGFPLASLNQTGIRACKIGLVTTLMALNVLFTSHPQLIFRCPEPSELQPCYNPHFSVFVTLRHLSSTLGPNEAGRQNITPLITRARMWLIATMRCFVEE